MDRDGREPRSLREDDRDLGMDRPITRRDFMHGMAALGVAGLLGRDAAARGPDATGGRASGYLPLAGPRISLEPSLTFRMADFDLDDEEFEFTDVALRAAEAIYLVVTVSLSFFVSWLEHRMSRGR